MIKQNVGPLDRASRIILSLILVVVVIFFKITGILGKILIAVSVIGIFEGIAGYSFLYSLFGWSTKRRKNVT